jgi:hypothetical protein
MTRGMSIGSSKGPLNPFHEKAGECQECFSSSFLKSVFLFLFSLSFLLPVDSFAFEPGRLCRHPSLRTLG